MKRGPVQRSRAGRPADSDSALTRSRIVECAQDSFSHKGFDGTTNRHIADAVGISTAALYHYFPSKADMYVAVCEKINATLVEAFGAVESSREGLVDRVEGMVGVVERIGREETSALVFVTGMWNEVRSHPEVARGTDILHHEFRATIDRMVRTATDIAEVLDTIPVEVFADFIASSLAGFGRMSARGQHDRQAAAGRLLVRLVAGSSGAGKIP